MRKMIGCCKQFVFSSFSKFLCTIVLLVSLTNVGRGQVNISVGSTVNQNFDAALGTTASTTWTNNSTVPGWYINSAPNLPLQTGTINANNVYNCGTAGTNAITDRALGALSTATTRQFGLRLLNNGATSITSFSISFTGEQWRSFNAGTLVFEYQTGATVTSLTAGTWTAATSFDFASLQTSAGAALDGNASANRTSISGTLTVTVATNTEIFFRWTRAGTSSPCLAIDDLSISANGAPATPATIAITAQDPNTPSPVDWGTGTTGNIFYWAAISPTVSNASLSSVTANMTGSYLAADIATNGLKLYYSADFTFTASSPDVLLSSQSSTKSGATETVSWSGLSQIIAQNGTGYIYAVADIASGASTGRTIAGTFSSDGNIIFNPAANYSAGNTYGSTTNKTIIQNPTNPATFAVSCASQAKINVNLSSPSSGTVLVFANTTNSFTAPTGAGSSYTGANSIYSSAANYAGVGGRLVYSGSGANFSLTGLTIGTTYHLKAYSYNNSIWSSGTTTISGTATTQPVTLASATAGNQQITLNWTNPAATSCYNNVIIIARAGSAVEASVSKSTFDGLVSDAEFTGATSVWTSNSNANDVYDLTFNLIGTDNTNFLVYKGTGTTVTLTGLTNYTTYFYSIFTVDGTGAAARWSNVVNLSATPVIANTANDYFRSNSNNIGTLNWNTASNWEYSPDNGVTAPFRTATLVPNSSSQGITIRNGHNITFPSGTVNADQLTIDAGATLTVSGGTFTINDGTGEDLSVNGTFTFSNGTINYLTGYTVSFGVNASYNHGVNGGNIPLATWDATSTCTVTGMTNSWPGNIGQTFGNFTWSCSSQSVFFPVSTPNFGTKGLLKVTASGASSGLNLNNTSNSYTFSFGAIEVTGGILEFSYLGASGDVGLTVVKVKGDVTVSGSGVIEFADESASATTVNVITGGVYPAILEIGGNLNANSGTTASTGFKASGTWFGLVLFSNTLPQSYNGRNSGANFNFGIDYAVSPQSSLTLQSSLSLDGANSSYISNNGTLSVSGANIVTNGNGGTSGSFYQNGNDIFSITGNLTNNSYLITSVNSTSGIDVGMSISGTGIPPNSFIVDFTANTIVLNNTAIGTASMVGLSVSSAGNLIVSANNGINATALSGSVQVGGTRFFSSTANYEFKGTNTGNFSTITSPIVGTVRNLTINNNTGNVNMGGNIDVRGALNLVAGNLAVNGNTLTISGTIPNPQTSIDNNTNVASTTVFNIGGYTINPGLFTPSGFSQNLTNNPGVGNTNTLNGNFTFNNSLTLKSGILSAGNNTITFRTGNTPIVRDGAINNGTLSLGNASNLIFGTNLNTVGNAFLIPDNCFTSSPVISSLTVNRTNQLTLGNQGMQLTGALTLTLGTLNIGPNTLLDLNGASLTATGGFLRGDVESASTSDFTVRGNSGGTVTIPQNMNIGIRTLTVTGNRYVSMNGSNNIRISNLLSVDNSCTFDTGGDASQITSSTSASPSVVISGRFITRHPGGFNGTGTSIIEAPITLNANSIVEYGRSGNQDVQGSTSPNYRNVTFSGSGTKTLLSTTSGKHPVGIVTITNTAIFDQSIFTFGDANTGLTMNGGRHRLSGTGTKPDIDGAYDLTGGVIEFYNSSTTTAQRIKGISSVSNPINYLNIEVTGSNVAQSNSNINLQSNGTFTIKNGGIFTNNADAIVGLQGSQTLTIETGGKFVTGNALGFYGDVSGFNSPSVRNNIETLVFQTNSTVEYSRTSSQNLTPTPVNYKNIIISGGGEKNLTGNVFMDEVLTLTNGLVNTSLTNLLTLTSTATCPAGGSFNSFVTGPMRKLGASNAFTFPVGKPTESKTAISDPTTSNTVGGYRPIAISALTDATSSFRAEFLLNPPPTQWAISQSAKDAGLQGISRCEHWDLVREGGTESPAVTLSWSENPLGKSQCNVGPYILSPNSAVVVPYFNNLWGDEFAGFFGRTTSTGLDAQSIGTITWNGVTPLFPSGIIDRYIKFVIGSISWQNAPLPATISSFKASPKDKVVQLDWQVLHNDRVKSYTVERSKDGVRFAPLKLVAARVNEQNAAYIDNDPAPFKGWGYYRLRITDFDGNSTYSATQKVWMGNAPIVQVSPNPVKDQLFINTANMVVKEISLINYLGQTLLRTIPISSNTILDLSKFNAGVYYVRILTNEGVLTEQVIKQ